MNTNEKEIWKKIKVKKKLRKSIPADYYDVSNLGRVRNNNTGNILKGYSNKEGTIIVLLRDIDGKEKKFRVCTLVADTFKVFRRVDRKMLTNIDGDKTNNNVNNLKFISHTESYSINKESGVIACGEKNGNSKYSDKVVEEICKLLSRGYGVKYVSDTLDVKRSYVKQVRARSIRTYISDKYNW